MASPQQNTAVHYHFTETQDWFSHNMSAWTALFPLVTSKAPRVLEIGSWEGRSAVFMLENLCKDSGEIVCIDHFDLLQTAAGRERYAKVKHNLSATGKPFHVFDEFSVPALMTLLQQEMSSQSPGFDWIYVDGSHEADDTLLDAELVWRLARKGAVLIFDDYLWDKEPADSIHHPKRGVDAFLQLHRGEYNKLSDETQYQVVLQKTTEMRIGFLVKERRDVDVACDFGYGVNIALAIGAAYAMPAAVAIRSAIEQTAGRISVYILEYNLEDSEKRRIIESLPSREDFTVLFLKMPEDSLTAGNGALWGKVDMLSVLPVERVLYLDADVLIRASLRELWDTDLQGHAIGATCDIGHPLGHSAAKKEPYFNAGVLLVDLAKTRKRLAELKALAERGLGSRFRDQDVLNAHFAGDWLSLSLKWNAQGLGTYSKYPSPDREHLRLSEMDDPCIVHFTGPVHPTLVDVLNPYVQPYTSKPWGYGGSPGHPYAGDWWAVLERTSWVGLRVTKEWKDGCESARQRAVEAAKSEFHEKTHGSI